MKFIFDYTDYRLFLRDRFEDMKRKNPLFSYQSFSRMAGARSSGFLKLVSDGKRNLADKGIWMIARGFRLSDSERRYFESLVKFNQATSHEEKDRHFRELSQHKQFLAAKPLTAAQYQLFSHWYYVAILELARLPSEKKKDAAWLQQRLQPEVALRDVKKALADLKICGLLEEDLHEGILRKEAMLASDDEIRSLSVANLHSQMSHLAARAVMEEAAPEREFSSLTVITSQRSFQRAKEEIQKFRKKLHSILEQDDEAPKDFVGQLNLQLFKLSKTGTDS
jgi:uncharacterized protein (TIGR02147 family)